MPEAVLVSAVRAPVGRAPKGALSTTRPGDLAALAVRGALTGLPCAWAAAWARPPSSSGCSSSRYSFFFC